MQNKDSTGHIPYAAADHNPALRRKIMEEAIKASAVTEHAIHCSLYPRPNVICRENRFQLRRIKEALFIRHNHTINRDKGVEISERNVSPSRPPSHQSRLGGSALARSSIKRNLKITFTVPPGPTVERASTSYAKERDHSPSCRTCAPSKQAKRTCRSETGNAPAARCGSPQLIDGPKRRQSAKEPAGADRKDKPAASKRPRPAAAHEAAAKGRTRPTAEGVARRTDQPSVAPLLSSSKPAVADQFPISNLRIIIASVGFQTVRTCPANFAALPNFRALRLASAGRRPFIQAGRFPLGKAIRGMPVDRAGCLIGAPGGVDVASELLHCYLPLSRLTVPPPPSAEQLVCAQPVPIKSGRSPEASIVRRWLVSLSSATVFVSSSARWSPMPSAISSGPK
uniref:Uncharacterized protein n=1 Tax=Trichuris muris TaxID=70415 RepID=A0A5S6R4W1_TRIMR